MKIAVLTLTFNCADILPFFIRHYLTFANKIVAWDDNSNDATRAILSANPNVEMREWGKPSGIDEELFSAHWKEHYPTFHGDYDWVIIADPDEFLYHPAMPDLLWSEQKQRTEVIRTMGFNMAGEGIPRDDGRQIWEISPMGVPAPVYSKPVVFRPQAVVSWNRGRHALENCTPRLSLDTPIKLLHYRYLGANYTRAKNAKNYSRCGMHNGDKGAAWSCSPDYKGHDKEHSPEWAEAIKAKAVDVLKL